MAFTPRRAAGIDGEFAVVGIDLLTHGNEQFARRNGAAGAAGATSTGECLVLIAGGICAGDRGTS